MANEQWPVGVSRRESPNGLSIRYDGLPRQDGARNPKFELLWGIFNPVDAAKIRAERIRRVAAQIGRNEHARTVDDLWNLWLPMAEMEYEANTLRVYRGDYDRYIKDRLGSTLIGVVNRPLIVSVFDDLAKRGREDGGPLSPKSLWNVRGLLHLLFQVGVDRGWLEQNPAHRIRLPRWIRRKKPAATTLETIRLLRVIQDPVLKMVVELAFGAGLRISEILGLREIDIYPRQARIHVQRAWITWAGYEKFPKNNQPRVIALPRWLALRLIEHQGVLAQMRLAAGAAFDPAPGLVCPNVLGGHLTAGTVRDHIAKACKLAGIRHLTPHDFRAGFVTLLRSELRVDDLDGLLASAGHADEETDDGYDRPPAPRATRSQRNAAKAAHEAWLRAVERDRRDFKNRP